MDGERRHETCRYSLDLQAWRYGAHGKSDPTTIPGCSWKLPDDAPPAVHRAWGGSIEPSRDCAFCKSYRDAAEMPATQEGE